MAHEVGQLVMHPTRGLGKVLRATRHEFTIYFKNASDNPVKISTSFTGLTLAASQSDPILDRIAIDGAPRGTAPLWTKQQARDKFLSIFPKGFHDRRYLERERDYKWDAHERWVQTLNRRAFSELLATQDYTEIVGRALRVEGQTNLLARFEKIALRNAVNEPGAASQFSLGLYDLVYGNADFEHRFVRFANVLYELPQQGNTGAAKWPIQTLFPYLALPNEHLFLKPEVTKQAAQRIGVTLNYKPRPNWLTYSSLLRLGEQLRQDLADLKPRDMIDIQSFIWVTGEDTYGG